MPYEIPPHEGFTFTTDVSGIITSVSPGVYQILGYTPDELIGRPFFDVMPPGPVRNSSQVHDALIGKKPFRCLAIALSCKDGQIVEAEISGLPIAETGYAAGCRGIARRAPRQPAADDLQSSRLSQAELLLDLICHDINNMNQIQMGYLDLAMQSLSQECEVYGYMTRCMTVLESSTSLIYNVQKLQQISTGTRTEEKVDLGRILGKAVSHYEEAHGRNVTFNFEPVCGCYVMANELLKDAFLNIIGNAIKHSDGAPVINVSINETVEAGEKRCIVSIEDNGPGIPDDMKSLLFNRFQSGHTATSGKGLGLYLVKKLVEGFHGTVWVEDRVPGDYHQGSRFVIVLPAAGGQVPHMTKL